MTEEPDVLVNVRPRLVVSAAVAGRVVSSRRHPNADCLRVAVVDTGGDQPLQIVYGGTRGLRPGDMVPVAEVGTALTVDGGSASRLRARNFRGVRSEAMLCSTDELGWTVDGPDEVAVLGGPVASSLPGLCHGPGCTREATVEYWCGERCAQVWAAQFGDATPKMSRVRLDVAVARLDDEDAAAARAASARITVPPAMLAVGASSIAAVAAITKAVEAERLNERLRQAFPDRPEEAIAEARHRAHTSLATYAEAVESVIAEDAKDRVRDFWRRLVDRWRREQP